MLYDPKWEEKVEVKLEPWQELLLKAADLIEEKGWCQRASVNAVGQYCITGAMGTIRNNDPNGVFVFITAYEKLKDGLGNVPEYWNDDPGRTKEGVIATVREIARKA